MTTEESLEQRVARLEAINDIEQLKHRYLRACDAKDAEGFKACFVPQGADLDYGPLGVFETVDDLVGIFMKIALEQDDKGQFIILDMHHGMHPTIEFASDTEASGAWTLRFRQLNLRDRTEHVMSGNYEDRYVNVDGEWKIQKQYFHVLWSLTKPLPEGFHVIQAGWQG